MKLYMIRKISGILLAGLLSAGVHAQTAATFTAEQQAVINIAAGLYPDLFTGGGNVTLANGYVNQSFTSGVTVGFRDGSVFTSGGPFGSAITNRGTVSAVTSQLTNLKNSVNINASADVTSLFNLAAQVYPSLLANGTSFQTSADGYLYKYFASSGIYAAIKNGNVYLKGGSYGNAYTSVGALNSLLTKLQTAVNGGGSTGGTTIPSGNYNLTVSGTVTISGPIAIAQPFSFSVNGIPAPNLGDQTAIRKAFTDSVASSSGAITITNFSYTTISNTANLVEFDVSVSATINQGGQNLGYTYALKYKYTK